MPRSMFQGFQLRHQYTPSVRAKLVKMRQSVDKLRYQVQLF
jgi:hypothetical protein